MDAEKLLHLRFAAASLPRTILMGTGPADKKSVEMLQ